MPDSFKNKKQLRFIITLGTGSFGASKANQIQLEGFRAIADIEKAGGQQMGTLRAQIFGVSQSDMNSATTLQWKPGTFIPSTIQVYAIDGAQQSLVFSGNIVNAWANYNNMPDVFLGVQAQSAYVQQMTPVAPSSFKGSVDVATIMSQLAATMGYTFENNGVNVQLADVYLPGTSLEKAKALAQHANIDLYLDDNILAITPLNTGRSGLIPAIGPDAGLDGYPTFDGVGVNFQSLFNPAVKFGGKVKLTTSVKQAAGTWIVTSINHHLESERPDGGWFSQIRGNSLGIALTK